jgi:hypothetical protein
MQIKLVTRESGALRRRLREVQADIDPRSRKFDRLRTEVKRAIVEDNTDKLYRSASAMTGVDRFGKALAQPATSTVKGWTRKGLVRQILAPHGLSSRTITNFRVSWQHTGKQWRAVIGWVGMPWLIYHLMGCAKGSNAKRPNWSLRRRDIGGIAPKGMAAIRGVFARFTRSVVKSGR